MIARLPVAARILLLATAVALAGDATHVASGTTRYEWDGVPAVWRSAVWFPVLVAGAVLALAVAGRRSRLAPARERSAADVLAAAAAVTALYALTAVLRGESETAQLVLCGAIAIAIWALFDPSPGAALGGGVAAVAGPLAEILVVETGAASYAPDSDGLLGVAPFLVPLYFAAGAVAFRMWAPLARA